MSDTLTFDLPTLVLTARRALVTGWHHLVVRDLGGAERLLDWLELKGYEELLLVTAGRLFIVRWR